MECPKCSSEYDSTNIYCSNCQFQLKKENSNSWIRKNGFTSKSCPKCNKKMQIGYIASGQGFRWRKTKPGFLARGEKINDSSNKYWDASYLSSYRCYSCRIITIQY